MADRRHGRNARGVPRHRGREPAFGREKISGPPHRPARRAAPGSGLRTALPRRTDGPAREWLPRALRERRTRARHLRHQYRRRGARRLEPRELDQPAPQQPDGNRVRLVRGHGCESQFRALGNRRRSEIPEAVRPAPAARRRRGDDRTVVSAVSNRVERTDHAIGKGDFGPPPPVLGCCEPTGRRGPMFPMPFRRFVCRAMAIALSATLCAVFTGCGGHSRQLLAPVPVESPAALILTNGPVTVTDSLAWLVDIGWGTTDLGARIDHFEYALDPPPPRAARPAPAETSWVATRSHNANVRFRAGGTPADFHVFALRAIAPGGQRSPVAMR